jgi:coenzyme F420-reducing hydrogenase delta subunit
MAKIEAPSEALYFSVPCAGRISENMLWATLSTGVSGILVVGCHPGNCASKYGTEWAGKRVNQILGKMQSVGIPSPQIAYTSVSSRETARLEGILRDFKASLKGNHDVFSKRNEIRK